MNETKRSFFLCIRNRGYAASLQVRTVYSAVEDPEAESHGMPRPRQSRRLIQSVEKIKASIACHPAASEIGPTGRESPAQG